MRSVDLRHTLAMKRKFLKFKVVSTRDPHEVSDVFETLLLNTDHLISIKPINMVLEGEVHTGFWLRTTNDKKYRAVEIPEELASIFSDEDLE